MTAFDVVLIIVSASALIWGLWNERRLDRIEGSFEDARMMLELRGGAKDA